MRLDRAEPWMSETVTLNTSHQGVVNQGWLSYSRRAEGSEVIARSYRFNYWSQS